MHPLPRIHLHIPQVAAVLCQGLAALQLLPMNGGISLLARWEVMQLQIPSLSSCFLSPLRLLTVAGWVP